MTVRSFAVALAALVALPAAATPTTWEVDPAHSAANFTVRHLGVTKVRGQMGKVIGTVVTDDKDITKSTVEATIETAGISTQNTNRDEHLRSPDFFDVQKHPAITFKSKKVAKAGKGKLKVTGDLTMRGVTKEVVLDVEGPLPEIKGPGGTPRTAATGTTKINRKDYGVAWSKMVEAIPVVSDDVEVTIDLALAKKEPAKPGSGSGN
jgi:polyisoprenoid-binding protein YceI